MSEARTTRADVFAALDRLLAASTAAAAKVPDRVTQGLARELRKRLAVRAWANPYDLIDPGSSMEEVVRALNTVAGEAEATVPERPGQWYLSSAARNRVLSNLPLAAIEAELRLVRFSHDADDPIRAALRIALGLDSRSDLTQVSEAILRALVQASRWLGDRSTIGPIAELVAAELATRTHRADIRRMTGKPLVGGRHRRTLEELLSILTTPSSRRTQVAYLYGSGGSGKSTVLAFLELGLMQQQAPPTIIRLDFDDPLINPFDPLSLDLALVEQLGRQYPEQLPKMRQLARDLRHFHHSKDEERYGDTSASPLKKKRSKAIQVESLSLESAHSNQRSDRYSLLYRLFDHDRASGRVVVILDTAEVLASLGEAAALELVNWIHALTDSYGANDLRVVIAGRDPSLGGQELALLRRLGEFSQTHRPLQLCDLEVDEAQQLLISLGVSDPSAARAAAEVVPRNPLLLRMTAEALVAEPQLMSEVRIAHREARVDPASASAYLIRRVVAHVADPFARPFILAALALPAVTRAQLHAVVMPVCGVEPGKPVTQRAADRLFRALKATRWLVASSSDGRTLTFHRDVRTLIVKLMTAEPKQAEICRQVHEAAITFHARRRTARDRSFGLYHAAMLGVPVLPVKNAEVVARYLREVVDDLPEEVRAYLVLNADRSGEGRYYAARDQDDAWRHYLEGAAGKDGEGDRLLKRDRAAEALQLYRERPTRGPGVPPTFVIRALADMGEWESSEVDVRRVVAELEDSAHGRVLSGQLISRLYWITRLALLRGNGRIDERHAKLIEVICGRMTNSAITTLIEVVAVAEAGLDRDLMTQRMRQATGASESATRVRLISAWRGHGASMFKPHIDALVVVQRDWSQMLRKHARNAIDVSGMNWVQHAIDNLDGKPISTVNKVLREMRRPATVSWRADDLEAGVLLLRGQTTEFLRPLRQALVELTKGPEEHQALMEVIEIVSGRMSVCPAEFSGGGLDQRLRTDPEAWSAAFVGFADKCRLLPLLCDLLAALPQHLRSAGKARRVATCFLAWDRAICGGRSSHWPGSAPPDGRFPV